MRMIQVGTWLEDRENPDALRSEWSAISADRKVDRLKGLFPTTWAQGRQLLMATKYCIRYRNKFDHSTVRFSFSSAKPEPVWELLSVSKRNGTGITAPINFALFDPWELRLHVVDYCFRYLFYPGIFYIRDHAIALERFDLRNVLIGDQPSWSQGKPKAARAWSRAVDWLFPSG